MRLDIKTSARVELVDITRQVAQAVAGFAERNGAVLVFCPHTTAAVTINENADPDVVRDLIKGLESIAPVDPAWAETCGKTRQGSHRIARC